MDGAEIVARDPRVRAILTEPDAYFSAAHRRAWPQARADIELELGRRTHMRRSGTRRLRLFRMFLGARHDMPPAPATGHLIKTRKSTNETTETASGG